MQEEYLAGQRSAAWSQLSTCFDRSDLRTLQCLETCTPSSQGGDFAYEKSHLLWKTNSLIDLYLL